MIEYALIFLVNVLYIPTIWWKALVSDDALSMVFHPYNLKLARTCNVILHITVAEYIYIAFGCSPISLLAAILFSIHPQTVQVSSYRSGRQYGVNALLFLFALTFAPLGALAYFAYGVNAGCASLVFTPFAFLATKFWWLAFLAPIVFWFSWKQIKRGVDAKIHGPQDFSAPLPQDMGLTEMKPQKLILVVKTFWFYSLSALLPFKNGYYNSFLQTFGMSRKDTDYWYSFNRHFWGGISVIGLMAFLLATNFKSNIGVGIILFSTSIAPFLNFISVQQFTAPRYAYLPLIGFHIALWSWLSQILPAQAVMAIASGLFAFYLTKLVKVMNHYKKTNIEMVYFDSLEFPDNPRIWYFRYEHMLNTHNPVMAWAEAQAGLRHLPEDCQLWFGLACASFELHDFPSADTFLKNAEKFLLLTDRVSMQECISGLRGLIDQALAMKWKGQLPKVNRRF